MIEPIPLKTFKNRQVLQIACGDYHTLALVQNCLPKDRSISTLQNASPTLFGWGDNGSGQISGQQGGPKTFFKPVPVTELKSKSIIGIDCYDNISAAFDTEGNLYEWGGLKQELRVVKRLGEVREVGLGNGFGAARTGAGSVFVWGSVKSGKKTLMEMGAAGKVVSGGEKIVKIVVGYDHILAVNKENEVSDRAVVGVYSAV